MLVCVNFSREVYDYFKSYDLGAVADVLLDMYDFTNLPPVESKRYTEKRINVTNEAFISLYETLGPRNKKVSLARLFEFAYNMDVLVMPRFEILRTSAPELENKKVYLTLLSRAYRDLLSAEKISPSPALRVLIETLYTYKELAEAVE